MEILEFLDNGAIFPAKVLSISSDSILDAFNAGAQHVTAVSLAIGYAHQGSVHHMMLNAFKNLACASIASGFGFKEADRLASAAASAPAQSSSAPADSGSKAAPAKKEEEPKEEEEDLDMGGLFGY
jgi:ribosomal protein L12E/L44/L45/RPP1/RPP2